MAIKVSEVAELKKLACEAIDQSAQDLKDLSQKIWKNPELNFKETKAHGFLTDFFNKRNFEVTPKWTLDTAFLAKYGSNEGPRVAILCEYDALPGIGHACGHNLIAEAGAAAALGIKAALDKSKNKLGQLYVIGTPAEEGGGGKLLMIENKCFEGVDFAMMVHPGPSDAAYMGSLCIKQVFVTFKGHAAHAAAFPWKGINALDAAVIAYSSISMMRQQFKPTWRVHGVILDGGVKPNIIPETTKMHYMIRAPKKKGLDVIEAKVTECFESAAKATGCKVEFEWKKEAYHLDLIINPKLADFYRSNAHGLGVQFKPKEKEDKISMASTDMGNVSHIIPSIHPSFSIGTKAGNHTKDFAAAAATDVAHQKTLIAGKAMAMTAIEVMSNPDTLKLVKEQFAKQILIDK